MRRRRGESITQMRDTWVCAHCGKTNTVQMVYCDGCGEQREDETAAPERVVPMPIDAKRSFFRRVVAKIFGRWVACSYCGKFYTARCHSNDVNLFLPLPQNGRCCPDGHEGYVDEFVGAGTIRHWFDLVEQEREAHRC